MRRAWNSFARGCPIPPPPRRKNPRRRVEVKLGAPFCGHGLLVWRANFECCRGLAGTKVAQASRLLFTTDAGETPALLGAPKQKAVVLWPRALASGLAGIV